MLDEEINAAVHEKVMGLEPNLSWQVLSPDGEASCFGATTKWECEKWMQDALRWTPDSWIKDYHVGTWKHCPPYVQQIGVAWDVVRKLREDDWIVAVKELPPGVCHIIEGARSEYDAPCEDQEIARGKASCELQCARYGKGPWRLSCFAFADTAARAICLVALKAVGVEVAG